MNKDNYSFIIPVSNNNISHWNCENTCPNWTKKKYNNHNININKEEEIPIVNKKEIKIPIKQINWKRVSNSIFNNKWIFQIKWNNSS